MHLNDMAALRARAAGFTLIEIMVVVVILGILAALVLPNVMGRIGQAQTTKVKADIQGYETALSLFKLDNFKYPSTDQGLEALVKPPADPSIRNWKEGGYIRSLKKDPWGNNYQYVYPGTHGTEYDLFTLGADAQPGGEGDNADIGNWNLD
ncbi:MAG TPA: type II secretion system major pseudopilin GspG [Steroidobacteraceae bacterium]|nr:type II secretion system major pseudopilin GspG [Steroidobacteraceae bacterium]